MSMHSNDIKAKLIELRAVTKLAQKITEQRFAHDKATAAQEAVNALAERIALQEKDGREWELVHKLGVPVVDGNTQTPVLVAWNSVSVTATVAANSASSLASTAASAVSSAVQQAAATGQVVVAKLNETVKKFGSSS